MVRGRSLALVSGLTLACTIDNPAWDDPSAGSGEATDAGGSTTEAPAEDWWDPAWRVRRPLTITNPTDATLVDPPIAISLTPARFDYGGAAADGRDLRVVASDGALLDLEIERWMPAGDSALWIRAPELPPGETRVWLYWDNADAGPPALGDLWAAYAAVYHLSDDLAGGLTIADATGAHDGHASPTMGPASAASGRIGGALRFAGTDPEDALVGDFVVIDDGAIDSDAWTGLTLEAWIRHAAIGEHRIVCKSASTTPADHTFALGLHSPDADPNSDGTDLYFRLGVDDTAIREYQTEPGTLKSGDGAPWYHVAATWDGARVRVFVDGAPAPIRRGYAGDAFVDSFDQPGATLRDQTTRVTLANVNDSLASADEARFWIGELDELRLSPLAHSPAWIRVQHLSMRDQLVDYSAADEPYGG
ncbi:MAG: hypothetical protein KC486_13885 [Myxococcales bacterium]|nr:hypothetical protein [Myxococcales bacterium]